MLLSSSLIIQTEKAEKQPQRGRRGKGGEIERNLLCYNRSEDVDFVFLKNNMSPLLYSEMLHDTSQNGKLNFDFKKLGWALCYWNKG